MAQVTFSSSVGGDGSTVSDDKNPTTGLDDGGHRTRFVPALSQVVAVAANTVASANAAATSALNAANAPNVSATSTTNLTIGIGNKTLTVQTGKAFVIGMSVKIAETITPTNWMHGTVTAYNSSTGSLTVSVDNISGTSTATGWTISGSAPSFLGISEHLPISKPSLNLDFANSEQVDPRITFVRDTTATRFNELGLLELVEANEPRIDYDPVTGECLGLLVEEQRTNLLTYSEQFDNAAWSKTNATVTSNATTAPDGTLTADKLVEDSTASNSHVISKNINATTAQLFSSYIYAKASERSQIQLTVWNPSAPSNNVNAKFDLSTGIVLSTATSGNGSLVSGTIESVGNGWYKCTVSGQPDTSGTSVGVAVYLIDNISVVYNGDGTSGIYIWGAQLEEGSFPTSYIPSDVTFTGRSSTATYYGSDGLIKTAASGEARYNYNPTNLSVAPKLLIEPQRTNLLTYSEQFDNVVWDKLRASITANVTTAPDGTLTADKAIEDTSLATTHIAYRQNFTSSIATYSHSVYVKAGERSAFTLLAVSSDGVEVASVDFDLVGVTSTSRSTSMSNTSSITSVGNGWYRCSLIYTDVTGGVNAYVDFRLSNSAVASGNFGDLYNGDGTSGIYIWGAQLEEGTEPSTYIPTTSATVTRVADSSTSVATTRNADVASMTGTNFSDWYRQDEGTIVSEHEWFTTSDYGTVWGVSDGTSDNEMRLIGWNTSFDRSPTIWSSGTSQTDIISSYTSNKIYKYAISYKDDDIATSRDGDNPMTESSATVPIVNSLSIGNTRGIAFELNGHIKNLKYYPVRLSNSELQALTL